MDNKSKSEVAGCENDFDDCLGLINQSVFSEKSYLEWLEGTRDQSRSSNYSKKLENSGCQYLQHSFSNQSEELLSTCSYDSRKNSQETSFHEDGLNELLYCEPEKAQESFYTSVDQTAWKSKPNSFCLCNLDTSRCLSRNIKISNCSLDGFQLFSFLSKFGDIHSFDQCKLYTERSVRVAYFDMQASCGLFDTLRSYEWGSSMELECLNDLCDFSTIDYFLIGKTDEYIQEHLVDFCTFFGEVLECIANPNVFIIKYSDVRSLKKIEKILENYKENEKNQIKFLRGIFNYISEKSLKSILSNMFVFNKDNCSEIFFNKISSEKLCRENQNLPQVIKQLEEEPCSKFKKRTLRISAESFLISQENARTPFADLTNNEMEKMDSNDCSSMIRSYPPSLFSRDSGKDFNFSVNLSKVLSKEDMRTTIMIRNIPNRFNQEALLRIIDLNFKGLYDFFYLPMDFKNKCNIGYAFINFIEPRCIIDFYTEFNDKRWDILRSEKICKVCYARIQGRNALIKHFKRSNIINLELEKNFKPLILPNSLLDFSIF